MKRKKILCFFGTRPEAIKMAPVVNALQAERSFQSRVCVSAQHRGMLDQVLADFKIRANLDLNIMQAKQSLTDITARVVQNFKPVLVREKPDLVLVHGDTTTTFAGALAAYYERIPVGHVEAGLRTNDLYRPFPEEANRRLTDALATLHFCPTSLSRKNLVKENANQENIFVTGNTVIDALLETVKTAHSFKEPALKNLVRRIKSRGGRLILMTAHRRENFGKPFGNILRAVLALSRRFPDVHWIYPVHPNPNVDGPAHRVLRSQPNVSLLKPLDYTDLIQVMNASTLVLTDSGGLQEEAPSLGKPVLVMREVTERPEAIQAGTVRLLGTSYDRIVSEVSRLLTVPSHYRLMANAVNPYGDGRAASRIVHAIRWYFGFSSTKPKPFGKK